MNFFSYAPNTNMIYHHQDTSKNSKGKSVLNEFCACLLPSFYR